MKKPKLQRIAFHPDWHTSIAQMPVEIQGQAYRAVFDLLLSDDCSLIDDILAPYLSEIFDKIAEMKAEAARKAEIRRQCRLERLARKQEEERLRLEEEERFQKAREREQTRKEKLLGQMIFTGNRGSDIAKDLNHSIFLKHRHSEEQKKAVALQVIDEIDAMICDRDRPHIGEFVRTFTRWRADALLRGIRPECPQG